MRSIILILLFAGSTAQLMGCRAKGEWSEADELRAKVLDLEKQLATASAQRDEANAKLGEIERARLSTGGELASDVVAALPRCAGIEIDRWSGFDFSEGATGEAIHVYVKPFDGRERFIQIVGLLRVRADHVPGGAAASAQPSALGSASLDPPGLREAFRSSPLGTHYFVRIPLATAHPKDGSLILSAEFTDSLTGRIHQASRVIQIKK